MRPSAKCIVSVVLSLHAHCTQVRLSSAAVPDETDDTTVVIGPPFYLEAKLAGLTIPIQDTQPGGGRKSILGEGPAFLLQRRCYSVA